jgi:hypothetical protein
MMDLLEIRLSFSCSGLVLTRLSGARSLGARVLAVVTIELTDDFVRPLIDKG